MNKKAKLLRKLNRGIIKVDLWNFVAEFALRIKSIELATFAHEQAKKNFHKNRELAGEMAKEDYSEDLRLQFEEISKIEL